MECSIDTTDSFTTHPRQSDPCDSLPEPAVLAGAIPRRLSMSRRRVALIASIALVARVAYVVAFMRHYMPTSDADSYYEIGRALSKGQGYAFTLPFEFVHATAIRPPL